MPATISTYKKLKETSPQVTSNGVQPNLFSYLLNTLDYSINDVLVRYKKGYDIETEISSKDLTISSMTLSQTSFSKEWDNEDDEYWGSYL